MNAINPLATLEKELENLPRISRLSKALNTFFEKCKGKTVQKVIEETTEEVVRHNRHARDGNCFCGGSLVENTVGTEGVFTWTSIVYRCTNCGTDYKRYSEKEHLDWELRRKGIKKIGNEYRYTFWCDKYSAALLVIVVLAAFIALLYSTLPS